MDKKRTYRLALAAILCAQALALSFLEGLLPPIPWLPPGAKPGLSNIIIMFAADSLGLPMALTIVLIKSGFAFLTRGASAALMSLAGGVLSALAMRLLLRYARQTFGLVGVSVICALCHNFGQLLAAAVLTGTRQVLYYAPMLALFGAATGVATGMILRVVLPALEKQKRFFDR